MKRLAEICFSISALAILMPFFLLIAVLVRIESPGPAFYRQKRVGKNGVLFTLFKFRSMFNDLGEVGRSVTAKNDPRVTRVGRFLRQTKIDEFPQLLNVLKGDMSLIGPRPELPEFVARYSQEEKEILAVKPGIIGLSQIYYRNETEKIPVNEDATSYYCEKILPEKLKLDLGYVRDKTPLKDVRILLSGFSFLFRDLIKLNYIFESRRRAFFLFHDILVALLSCYCSFLLRFEGQIPDSEVSAFIAMLPFLISLRSFCFVYFGLYQTLWQYLGVAELFSIIKAVTVSSILLPLIPFLFQLSFPPRSILIMDWFMLIVLLGGSRVVFKSITVRLRYAQRQKRKKNVLLIGANDASERLAREFIRRPDFGCYPVGFLDEDPFKQGIRVHGIKVLGRISQLAKVVQLKKVSEIIIAPTELTREKVRDVVAKAKTLNIRVQIIPPATMILAPQFMPLKIREVEISDMFRRELAKIDFGRIRHFFNGKKVLVTGAAGSIGSELSKMLCRSQAQQLILVDQDETALFELERELRKEFLDIDIRYCLSDIANEQGMSKLFSQYLPNVIYHAAAYKHVPLMESNPSEAILNNVLGTKCVANLALRYQAERFVLISTDKAINPRSIMGATKRIAELYIQNFQEASTSFLTVRFGNVFNSQGSVVPLIKRQIEEGGPITITDPNAERYFMELSEAVFLIMEASIAGTNGTIFVLDMGEPIKIVNLVHDVMLLMGVYPSSVPIVYTGLRPGEKLKEEIYFSKDQALPTFNDKIKIWKSGQDNPDRVNGKIEELLCLANKNSPRELIIDKIREIVPEYVPWSPA